MSYIEAGLNNIDAILEDGRRERFPDQYPLFEEDEEE